MPTDPAHGRDIPSGHGIARVLSALFQRQQAYVLTELRAGSTSFDLSRWTQPAIDLLMPVVTPFYRQGGEDALRRIRRELPRRLHTQRGYGQRGVFVSLQVKDVVLPGTGFDVFNPRVTEFIRSQIFHFIDSANQTSADDLRRVMQEALQRGETGTEITRRVNEIFANPVRSQMIAATEASRAMHAGQVLAAKDSGVVHGLQWLASSDACDLCLELNGKEIALGGTFAIESGGGPYATIQHPPRHPRCQCTLTEILSPL